MAQAQFYYRNENAPQSKGNRIGTCVLLQHNEKLLLEHRADSDTWAIIGGGLKADESLAEGAIREVFVAATHIPIVEEYVGKCW